MIETHVSVVLLAGSYAYKFKKALDLGKGSRERLQQAQQETSRLVRLLRNLLVLSDLETGHRSPAGRVVTNGQLEIGSIANRRCDEAAHPPCRTGNTDGCHCTNSSRSAESNGPTAPMIFGPE